MYSLIPREDTLFLSCPKPEKLLELFTIPGEISLRQRVTTQSHAFFCADCQAKLAQLKKSWQSYFKPEPDITPSLLRVYSRLQNDETLILRGWKLGETKPQRNFSHRLFREGWLFRGGVSVGVASLLGILVFGPFSNNLPQSTEMVAQPRMARQNIPLVQYRIENKDRVKVHYLKPELLQTIEFETTSAE